MARCYVNMWWHMNTRVVGIRFKPKRRNQKVKLTKWSDSKSNWVDPSLSWNLQKFTGSLFENLFVLKEVFLSLRISHGTFTTIRCPYHKLSSPEYWSKNLDWRRDIKRSDWSNNRTARATARFPHYHRTYKSL